MTTLYNIQYDKYYFPLKQLNFQKIQTYFRLTLARFSREMACLPSRKILANESLRSCDVRLVLCILTIFCRFKPKKRLYSSKILEFSVVSKRNNTFQML